MGAQPPGDRDTSVDLDDDDLCVETDDGAGIVRTYIPLDVVRWLLARHAEDTKRRASETSDRTGRWIGRTIGAPVTGRRA